MAARVITFRSALLPAKDEACLHVDSLPQYRARQLTADSYKVLPMFSPAQFSPARESFATDPIHATPSMLAKVQAEWADRYVEVEIEGLTLKRLGCIYLAAVQQTRFRMLQGVRSIFHLNPAH